ncbi:MAG: hypothetical protein ACRDU9_00185, partial [Acidimicrobiia bacterium]
MSPLVILAATTTALAAGLVMRWVVPPPRRLRGRVDPYVSPTLTGLATPGEVGPLRSVFGPILRDLANWLGRRLDRSGSRVTLLRLRQAGWFKGHSEEQMLFGYRMTQLKTVGLGLVVSLAAGQVLGASIPVRVMLVGLGLVFGATRTRGRLDR